jgi:polysaccharide export outer membrane protein
MKNKKIFLFSVFLIAAMLISNAAGYAAKVSAQRRPTISGQETVDYFNKPSLTTTYAYYIQPGDGLSVRWIDGPEVSSESMYFEVSADGKIKFPYLEDIFIVGLTADELAHGLEIALKKYFATPQVYVIVAKKTDVAYVAGTYTIYGEVGRMGKYKMSEDLTVSDAIFNAGGFTGFARKNGVCVIRTEGNETKKIKVKIGKLLKTGDVSLDTIVKEGDIILVPESWF